MSFWNRLVLIRTGSVMLFKVRSDYVILGYVISGFVIIYRVRSG
jgi:hypothetical protein